MAAASILVCCVCFKNLKSEKCMDPARAPGAEADSCCWPQSTAAPAGPGLLGAQRSLVLPEGPLALTHPLL